jgi:hypothetical protein
MRIGLRVQLALFGAALLHVATGAVAQSAGGPPPPSLTETLAGDAKRQYDIGKGLYESGDYAGALAAFQNASRASNDPRLLWNAAVCERAMQHHARAIVLVRRYLDSRSPLILPEAARNAQLFLDAAEPLTAHLDVEANQPDAVVFVDGEPVGTVPLGPGVRVDAGTHLVSVKKRNFNDYTRTLTITGLVDVHVSAVLSAIAHQGRVTVRAGPEDMVTVDDVAVAVGNWTGVLPSGAHSIVVAAANWPAFESQIMVVDNETRTVDLNAVDVTTAASKRTGFPPTAGIPTWAWVVGGGVLAGVITAGYVLLKSPETQRGPLAGSIGPAVQLP